MAKLTNPSVLPIDLPAGHIIPAKGSLELTNEAIRGDNWATLSGLIHSGAIAVEYDPEPIEETAKAEAKPKPLKGA